MLADLNAVECRHLNVYCSKLPHSLRGVETGNGEVGFFTPKVMFYWVIFIGYCTEGAYSFHFKAAPISLSVMTWLKDRLNDLLFSVPLRFAGGWVVWEVDVPYRSSCEIWTHPWRFQWIQLDARFGSSHIYFFSNSLLLFSSSEVLDGNNDGWNAVKLFINNTSTLC